MSSAEVIEESEPNAWWTTLKHEGVLLSPPVLEDTFPDGPPEIREREIDKLRRNYREFRNNPDQLRSWLDTVFEDLLDHTSGWEKEHLVSDEHTYQDLKPNRVLVDEDDDPRLAVWIDDDRVTDDDGEPGRIGIYSGRRTYADLVKLLRNTEIPIGILTNGHQFRVVNATLDRESWTEWDTEAWFEGGEGRDSLQGFYGLLSDEVLASPAEDEEDSLIDKIEESRDRQADLSDVMGTQVRESVEMLLQELDSVLMEVDEETREEILAPLKERDINRQEELRARYQASIRIIMRLVVALYAESRELFPKENPVYYDSYSVEGLFRELREAKIEESEEALEKQYGAWPRLQSLSRLIYHGSPHPDIPMQSYGGRLFRPPSEDGEDDVLAGIEVFEHDEVRITDATILEILENLKIAEFRSGGSRRRGPVDFSELRTEYIGMMYEGLLDYDLREAREEDEGIVFLNVGDKPALPFSVLEDLDEEGIETLIENLKDETSGSFLTEEKVKRTQISEESSVSEDEPEEGSSSLRSRLHTWARRVVEVTGVYMPHPNSVRAMDPTTVEKAKSEAANKLIERFVPPGGTYLVTWSGNRKSSGTFYTPPEMAIPTVKRSLQPVLYEEKGDNYVPKPPKEILDTQICDPAVGSGTFLIASLNHITEVLEESFEFHIISDMERDEEIKTTIGEDAQGLLNEELLTITPGEENWREKFEVQLRRIVVERCLYGVDINPLAVEFAKLSLWIETLSDDLPFSFLDHKIRVGNSLIGTWTSEFLTYPIGAWKREGGDGEDGQRTQRIDKIREETIIPQLETERKRHKHDTSWFKDDRPDTSKILERANSLFQEVHKAQHIGDQEQVWEKFNSDSDIQQLRYLMDRWCALWFWPVNNDSIPVLEPSQFYDDFSNAELRDIVTDLSSKHRFFHWEIEFPDVFMRDQPGFDAIVGNPPWEAPSPENDEFFIRYDPAYRAYDADRKEQVRDQILTSNPQIQEEYYNHVEKFRSIQAFTRSRETEDVLNIGGENTPYKYQKGNNNYYKLFLELSHYLLNDDGQLGMIFPINLISGKYSRPLRELIFENSRIRYIASFTNSKKIFPIASNQKFCTIILAKGKRTTSFLAKFMIEDPVVWIDLDESSALHYSLEQIKAMSPDTLNVNEFKSQKVLDLVAKVNKNGVPTGDYLPDVKVGRDLHDTYDKDLFDEVSEFENAGYTRQDGGIWENDQGDQALPVWFGELMNQFKFANKYVDESGEIRECSPSDPKIRPKNLMKKELFKENSYPDQKIRLAVRAKARPTDGRTIISALLPNYPSLITISFFKKMDDGVDKLTICGVMNSYVFDYLAKRRVDTTVAWFILSELPIPEFDGKDRETLARLTAKLNWHPEYFPDINEYTNGAIENIEYVADSRKRAEIREEIDEIIADSYGLTDNDMEWILRPDNEDPRSLWGDYKNRLEKLGGKGRWGELQENRKNSEEMNPE